MCRLPSMGVTNGQNVSVNGLEKALRLAHGTGSQYATGIDMTIQPNIEVSDKNDAKTINHSAVNALSC
jgi:hypothetical protein